MLRFFGEGVEGYSPKPLPQKTKACVLPKNEILRLVHMLRIFWGELRASAQSFPQKIPKHVCCRRMYTEVITEEYYECTRLIRNGRVKNGI